jgi:beta-1,4-mannosyl-glycoprotein beta-1,4-N-acetylglucosaminyltransferase
VPKVHDCFIFFNELDLLEIRLNELDGVVDKFVLCESPYNFRGQTKPLYFHENRERFARFLPKIVHVVVEDIPLGGRQTSHDYFIKERFQRNAVIRGLAGADPDDFVILCDVDEIPRASVIEGIVRDQKHKSVHTLEMRHCVYFLNLHNSLHWDKPRVARFGDIRRLQALRSGGPSWTPKQPRILPVLRQWKRMVFGIRPRPWIVMPDAGWHFSSMNGPAAVHRKMNSYAHVRPDLATEMDIARDILVALDDALSEQPKANRLQPMDQMPAFVQANRDRFAALIATPETRAQYRALVEAGGG